MAGEEDAPICNLVATCETTNDLSWERLVKMLAGTSVDGCVAARIIPSTQGEAPGLGAFGDSFGNSFDN